MDEAAQIQTGPSGRVHDAWEVHHERLWRSGGLVGRSGDRIRFSGRGLRAGHPPGRRHRRRGRVGLAFGVPHRRDPTTDRWRVLAPPPTERTSASTRIAVSGAVWTGSEMLVLANTGNLRGPALPKLFAYDPATDEWSTRTAGSILGGVTWTGDRLVVFPRDSRAAVYDSVTDSWSDLRAIPEDHPVFLGSVAWVDDQLVVWGNDRREKSRAVGYRLRLGEDAWRLMAEAPIPPSSTPTAPRAASPCSSTT